MKQHLQGRQSFAIGSSHSLHFLQTNSNAMLHYISWASERYVNQSIRDPINNSKDCRVRQLTKETRSCHVIISFTKVCSIGSIEDDDKTGKVGKGHNDPKALVDHQDLGVLSQLALVNNYLC